MRKGLRYARVGFLTRQAILDGRLRAGCGKTSAGFTLKLWNEARLVCVFVVGGGDPSIMILYLEKSRVSLQSLF